MWAFYHYGKQGLLFVGVQGLLLFWGTGSRHAVIVGSVIVAHGLSCSTACGIILDQELNPCPLHWQADSYPLCHKRKYCLLVLCTHKNKIKGFKLNSKKNSILPVSKLFNATFPIPPQIIRNYCLKFSLMVTWVCGFHCVKM